MFRNPMVDINEAIRLSPGPAHNIGDDELPVCWASDGGLNACAILETDWQSLENAACVSSPSIRRAFTLRQRAVVRGGVLLAGSATAKYRCSSSALNASSAPQAVV